jgi:hypothetical protein
MLYENDVKYYLPEDRCNNCDVRKMTPPSQLFDTIRRTNTRIVSCLCQMINSVSSRWRCRDYSSDEVASTTNIKVPVHTCICASIPYLRMIGDEYVSLFNVVPPIASLRIDE